MDTIEYLVDDCVSVIASFSSDLHASMLACTCSRFLKLVGVSPKVKGANLLSGCIKADNHVMFTYFLPMFFENTKESKAKKIWGELFVAAGSIPQTPKWVGLLYGVMYRITPNYAGARAHILEGAIASKDLDHFWSLSPSVSTFREYISSAIKYDNIPLLKLFLGDGRFDLTWYIRDARTVETAKFCLDYEEEHRRYIRAWRLKTACRRSGWDINLLRLFATHNASKAGAANIQIYQAPLPFVEEIVRLYPDRLKDPNFIHATLKIKGLTKSKLMDKIDLLDVPHYQDLRKFWGIRFIPDNATFDELFKRQINRTSSVYHYLEDEYGPEDEADRLARQKLVFDFIARVVRAFKPEKKYMKQYAEYIMSNGLLPCIYGRRVIAKRYLPK